MHLVNQLPRDATHDARALQREVDEIEEDWDQVAVGVSCDGVAEEPQEGFVNEEGWGVILRERQGEEFRLLHEGRDEPDVELGVDVVQPCVLAVAVGQVWRRGVPIAAGQLLAGALGEVKAGFDEGDHVPLLQLCESAGLELGDAGGRRAGWRLIARADPTRVRGGEGDRRDVGGVVFREAEASGEQRLANGLAVSGGDEDEVGIVCGDEEDGDAGHGEGSSQINDPLPCLHPRAADREDDVCVL